MIGWLRCAIRLALSGAWIFLLALFLLLLSPACLRRANDHMRRMAFQVGCRLWGIRVEVQGYPANLRPLLLVSNHFSYLDVFALGAIVPARFTPKAEIASWPVVGPMCRLMRCVFIDRRPARARDTIEQLARLGTADAVISLFPEGTTNEGETLLPFRSSLFQLADARDMAVQPVTLRYLSLSGRPFDAYTRPKIGWYGDAEFFPHVLQLLRERYVEVKLYFHAPVFGCDFASRKALALHCQTVIAKDL